MILKRYLEKILEITTRGDAREESYYSNLENLLNNFTNSINKKKIYITTLPIRTDAGNPDFRIWDGKQNIVGYIEAKRPEVNLDKVEDTEQIQRYLKTFPNLILTNFLEFRLYRNGQKINRAFIDEFSAIQRFKTIPDINIKEEKGLSELLNKFFAFSLPKFYTAKSLAVELANRTRFLKEQVIIEELREEEKTGNGSILGFYKAFQEYLIKGITKEDFADLYAQTITYGLFAARIRSQNGFNRKLAYDNIPETIGILQDIFKFISLGKIPQQMEWIIDDISEVLAVTDVKNILHQYFHEGKGKDPIVHFYETFLTEYDPKTREKRGVYYTPEPVVSYITRSLQNILKEHFNKIDGFANDSVTVLDPAAGTLTFLSEASKLAVEEFVSKQGDGNKEKFIKEHILKNFYAFELMMAPYAVGHLKISFLLEELGYRLQRDDRFQLYLTNTLEMEEITQTQIPGMSSLSKESRSAGKIKKEQPILVILGNPPYSGHSSNIGDWILREIKAYYKVDGKPLKERNPKWLQDDYVKFIRFAQWKIDQSGEGILGFITNHSYLDNPTFRGMRQSLMNSFNEIYILDLHGNSLKKEKSPDGSKDENVFDIQQGVAIAFFIKKKDKNKECRIHHSEIWGLRETKYDWLLKNEIKTTEWKEISPKSEFYLFIPRDEELLESYEKYPKITEIFPVNSVGIVTSRDNFTIATDKELLKRHIRMFCNENLPDEVIRQTFKLKDKPSWKLKDIRTRVRKDENREDLIVRILYRPFDIQWIFYHEAVIERSRKEVMRHMMQENLGLLIKRQNKRIPFSYAFVSNLIVESCVFESAFANNTLCPLYLYPDTSKKDIFSHLESDKRKSNLNPKLVNLLVGAYDKEPSSEEIFYYIYSILYSNVYRIKYTEFLKIDFPRIPFTRDYELFSKIAEYGKRLVDLHLLKSQELELPIAKFQGQGNSRIEKLRYEEKEKRVYINKEQYFEGIEKEVWEYQIGGYQVLSKWLKDRINKILLLEDTSHYLKIVRAIKETIELQKEIDKTYPEIEKTLIN